VNVHSVIRIAMLGLIIHSARALAQSDAREAGEIGIYAGPTAGALGSHAAVGSNFGRAFSRYTIALFDLSFAPLGARTLLTYPGVVTTQSRLYDFNFTVHVRVPVHKRWGPYGILGGGLVFNTYEKQILEPGGVAHLDGKSYAAFGFETGGGVRYYAAENWGIRAEYRCTFSTQNFSRVLGGVFYQFEGDDFWFRFRHGRQRGHRDLY
jgi:opacity protein-like surface antigen